MTYVSANGLVVGWLTYSTSALAACSIPVSNILCQSHSPVSIRLIPVCSPLSCPLKKNV